MNIVKTILEYFTHSSTWKGLIGILTAAGVAIEPVLADKIVAAGLALIGVVQVFVDDHDKTGSITKQ
jgi:hypothetical protein